MPNKNPLIAMFASSLALVAPSEASHVEACINAVSQHPRAQEILYAETQANDTFWYPADDWRAQFRPYVVEKGILQIPVKGVLLNDFGWALGNWATGYDYIWKAYERGLADPEVRGIALIINSPGGLVAGNFELVDKMYERRDEKPLRAFAADHAYSAAYSIASVAPKIVVTRTGGVGSIGVVVSHFDQSKMLDQIGLKITFIHYGKHKVDGNSAEPLPDDVKQRIQARIDELGEIFVSTVARNRGMDAKAIRETEALTFTASQAVSNGLADEIGSLDDAVSAFADDMSSTSGDEEMSTAQDTAAPTEAALNAARDEGRMEGHAAGVTEGAAQMQERIAAIMDCEEATGKQTLARHFAMKTAMSVDDAKAALAASPAEKVEPEAKGGNALDDAMDRTGGGANVEGADRSRAGNDEGQGDDPSAAIVALARANGVVDFVIAETK